MRAPPPRRRPPSRVKKNPPRAKHVQIQKNIKVKSACRPRLHADARRGRKKKIRREHSHGRFTFPRPLCISAADLLFRGRCTFPRPLPRKFLAGNRRPQISRRPPACGAAAPRQRPQRGRRIFILYLFCVSTYDILFLYLVCIYLFHIYFVYLAAVAGRALRCDAKRAPVCLLDNLALPGPHRATKRT